MTALTRHAHNVLGLNARSLEYTKRANPDEAIRLANNKLGTKKALQKAGVPTPRLYAKISSLSGLHSFRWTKLPASFVLKPNSASGGGGIVVVFGRNKKGNWVKADKSEIFIPELKTRVNDILDGNYSASHIPDQVLFEQRILMHNSLKPYSVRGVPDVRVLVYNKVPIMAMLRLPTDSSGARANLHAGGIGVGIDIVHGYTTTATQHGRIIETLPGTRLQLSGIKIPYWNKILTYSIEAAKAIGLEYAGVDIAIDRNDGPFVLEVNARPGLEIQVANMAPLKSRLARVEGLKIKKAEKGVQIAQSLFSEDVEEEIADISGRTVLGIKESITIPEKNGQEETVIAKIDTGAYRTTIDKAIAEKLDLHNNVIKHKEVYAALGEDKRPIVPLTFSLRGKNIKTEAFIADRSNLKHDAIIGRRDLKGFLVDPTKIKPHKP